LKYPDTSNADQPFFSPLAHATVDVPAASIANSLFGLTGSYYRDLLVLALAFTLGFAAILTLAVWQKMKDRR
jgi:hypothetical protein